MSGPGVSGTTVSCRSRRGHAQGVSNSAVEPEPGSTPGLAGGGGVEPGDTPPSAGSESETRTGVHESNNLDPVKSNRTPMIIGITFVVLVGLSVLGLGIAFIVSWVTDVGDSEDTGMAVLGALRALRP